MRSRVSLTLMIAAGLMLSTTGATLAVTGIAGDGSASVAQYGDVAGDQEEGGGSNGGNGGKGGTLGDRVENGAGNAGDNVDPQAEEQQVATTGGDSLPFTGYAAFPILFLGVALLVTGGVMRLQFRTQS